MCGLTGILDPATTATDLLQDRVAAMTETLHRRGPDASGIWVGSGIALGHRRLSILELTEAGAQPMHSACERFVMVFNGEIYNHLDLRADLTGTDWRGHSDTETLLAGIAHWGLDETLRRAAGMFALALWDTRESILSLVRDRIGEKPLYWGWAGRAIVFGSELKALRTHPDFPRDICRGALAQYLRFAYVPAPRSIHPGIYKLEPGCILQINGPPPAQAPAEPLRPDQSMGSLSIRRYWSLNAVVEAGARDQIQDENAAVAGLEDTLTRAVQRQMLADVPLGAFLSGGVDSSAIVALMQAHSTRAVKTFTIGFDDPAYDESPHAAAVAAHLGTDHNMMRVTDSDAQAVIPYLPELYDEPFADSSQIPTHLVCRAARAQVTVALSGDAGDELFGGYNRYFWGPRIWNKLAPIPFPLRKGLGLAIAALPASGWDGLGAVLRRVRGGRTPVAHLGDKAHRLASRLRHVKTHEDLYRSLVSVWADGSAGRQLVKPPSGLDDMLPDAGVDHPAALMMLQDMRSYLPDDILCKVDRAAMGVSFETWVPFLDTEVIRFRRPSANGYKDPWPDRKIGAAPGAVSPCPVILDRKTKNGLRHSSRCLATRTLARLGRSAFDRRSPCRRQFLDTYEIRKGWASQLSGRSDENSHVWTISMFQARREAHNHL